MKCAHEDIYRLNEVLRTLGCTAVLRRRDGLILSPNSATDPISAGYHSSDTERLNSPSGASALCTPIFDEEGRLFAWLDVIQGASGASQSAEPLLRALIEPAARGISERWFRLLHRHHLVVAAMRRNGPKDTVLFAIDREQRLIGSDRAARQLLKSRGHDMGCHLGISVLFRPNATLLRCRGLADVATTLFASVDGEPWVALITPPDLGALESYSDARAWLHVRSRHDSLIHLSSLPSTGPTRGLSQRAMQRIEEYVDVHLDSALDIAELAAIARMSSSQFSRSFHKSVGVTPHRYVIQSRVMRARELLSSTNLPLTEIALTTGFSDQSHLSRRFNEIVGIPPGAFRNHDSNRTP